MKLPTMLFILTLLAVMLASCATLPRERIRRNILTCTKDLMDYTKDLAAAFEACEKLEKSY